jgi:hypothetical protein
MRYGNFGRQICIPIMNAQATDEKTLAERQWREGLKPAKAQLPMDVGMFGDEHLQLDLVEMFQEPTND